MIRGYNTFFNWAFNNRAVRINTKTRDIAVDLFFRF